MLSVSRSVSGERKKRLGVESRLSVRLVFLRASRTAFHRLLGKERCLEVTRGKCTEASEKREKEGVTVCKRTSAVGCRGNSQYSYYQTFERGEAVRGKPRPVQDSASPRGVSIRPRRIPRCAAGRARSDGGVSPVASHPSVAIERQALAHCPSAKRNLQDPRQPRPFASGQREAGKEWAAARRERVQLGGQCCAVGELTGPQRRANCRPYSRPRRSASASLQDCLSPITCSYASRPTCRCPRMSRCGGRKRGRDTPQLWPG